MLAGGAICDDAGYKIARWSQALSTLSSALLSKARPRLSPADPERELRLRLEQRQSERALTLIERHYGPRLKRLALRLLDDEDDVADAMQETMIAIHRSLDRFGGRSRVYTWVYRVALQTLLNWRRARSRRRRRENPSTMQADMAGAKAPDKICEEHFRRQMLRSALLELPARQRMTLLLFEDQGFSIRRIANFFQEDERATRARLHRARATLRKALQKDRRLPGEELLGLFRIDAVGRLR
ncbi:MAG: RNA polymerase sigma factor [Leptospirales bacterium]|nr:RNA polymerase sigma factor [Leptospirales bacterium]